MNTAIPTGRNRSPWKLAAELLFAVWVIAVNIFYYSQFKELAVIHLKQFFHR
jgi:hypothetical protein